MYKVGQNIIHIRNGLSTIFDIVEMNERQYYIVRVNRGDGENIYVPVLNADSIIRPILSKEEADSLLKSLKEIKKEFNPNTKQRRDAFKKRLSSGKVEDIAYMYRLNCLYTADPENVKLGASDIDMLNYAKTMFLDELCLTYEVNMDEIESLILTKIK